MLSRHLVLIAGLLLCAGKLVDAQDAQDRRQSFFDNHKDADVINPDRGITDKAKQSPESVQQSTLPPLTGISEQELKEMRNLQRQRGNFVKKKVSAERKVQEKAFGVRAAMLDEPKMQMQAEKDWEKEKKLAAERLKFLERKSSPVRKRNESALPKLSY